MAHPIREESALGSLFRCLSGTTDFNVSSLSAEMPEMQLHKFFELLILRCYPNSCILGLHMTVVPAFRHPRTNTLYSSPV
jgi:hypothetical protein